MPDDAPTRPSRGPPGGGALRRRTLAGPVRRPRLVPTPGGGVDVGDRGPVGEHRGRRTPRRAPTTTSPLTATLAIVTGVLGLLAGLLRLGFLASFISEPVLKGFIVGLALTIIVGQVPKLFGVPRSGGDFFEQHGGPDRRARATLSAATLVVGLASLAVVLGLRTLAAAGARRRSSWCCSASRPSALFDLVDQGRRDRRADRVRAAVRRSSAGSRLDDYLAPGRRRRRRAAGRLRRGPGRGQDVRRASRATTSTPTRELLGHGCRQPGLRPARGMVVNGSLSKTAVNGGAGAKTPGRRG